MDVDSSVRVLHSLRSGTFLDSLDSFSDSQLRPFLPLLVMASFENDCLDHSMDALRCRLMSFPSANSLLSMLRVDAMELRTRIALAQSPNNPNANATLIDRIATLATFLLKLVEDNAGTKRWSQFVPCPAFDDDYQRSESLWMLVVVCLRLPALVTPATIAPSLLLLAHGPEILVQLVLNLPESVLPVQNALFALTFPDEDSLPARQRDAALTQLLHLNDTRLEQAIDEQLDRGNFPLAINFLSRLPDAKFIARLAAVLVDQPASEFCKFLHKSTSKPTQRALHLRLTALIQTHTSCESLPATLTLLHAISAFRYLTACRQSSDERRIWTAFLLQRLPSAEFLRVSIATLIASAPLIPGESDEDYGHLLDWLVWLGQGDRGFVGDESAELDEFLLLVTMQMHGLHSDALAQLLSSVLLYQVSLNQRQYKEMRALMLAQCIDERAIVERAAHVRVTRQLQGNMSSALPAHCVLQLLTMRSFVKHRVPIREWIVAQLMQSCTPIHPVLPDLLDAFASSCIPRTAHESCNSPFDESFLRELFAVDALSEVHLVPRILALFFLLSYRHHRDASPLSDLFVYSTLLESAISVRYLIAVVLNGGEDFAVVRGPLLRYAVMQCDFLLPTGDELQSCVGGKVKSRATREYVNADRLRSAFHSLPINPREIMTIISQLTRTDLSSQVRLADALIDALGGDALEHVPQASLEALGAVWQRLQAVIPRRLYQNTISSWSRSEMTHESLCANPLLVFRCDERVFRAPIQFDCLLRALKFYLTASRSLLHRRLAIATPPKSNLEAEERKELCLAVIGAQETAVVQCLLEICDHRPGESQWLLRRIRRSAAALIHHMFIVEPMLSKLVHFQMYPTRLIAIAVSEIPSMHICLDFIPELLAQPDLERRVFAIALLAELAVQYRIPAVLARAQLAVDVLETLITQLPVDQCLALFEKAMPSLEKLIVAVPALSGALAALLSRVTAVARARLAMRTCAIHRKTVERELIEAVAKVLAECSTQLPL